METKNRNLNVCLVRNKWPKFNETTPLSDYSNTIKNYIEEIKYAILAKHIIEKDEDLFDKRNLKNNKNEFDFLKQNKEDLKKVIKKYSNNYNDIEKVAKYLFYGLPNEQEISCTKGLNIEKEIGRTIKLNFTNIKPLEETLIIHSHAVLLINNYFENLNLKKEFNLSNEIFNRIINITMKGSDISYILEDFSGLNKKKNEPFTNTCWSRFSEINPPIKSRRKK